MTDNSDNSILPSMQLPILQQIRINSPCPMNWDEMEGDASKRFCGKCQKHVHNFSEMDAASVSELLGSGQSICAKLRKRSDGTVVTKEALDSCEVRISRRGWFARLGTLAASIAAILTLSGCREQEPVEMTGDIAMPPTAQAPELLGETDIMGGATPFLGDVEIPESQPANSAQNNSTDILGRVGPPQPDAK